MIRVKERDSDSTTAGFQIFNQHPRSSRFQTPINLSSNFLSKVLLLQRLSRQRDVCDSRPRSSQLGLYPEAGLEVFEARHLAPIPKSVHSNALSQPQNQRGSAGLWRDGECQETVETHVEVRGSKCTQYVLKVYSKCTQVCTQCTQSTQCTRKQ